VILLIELLAFLVTLIVPGYLLVGKYFDGLEKWVLSVFLSFSITGFFYYFVVSFFGISKELIYAYSLVLLLIFFVIKKPNLKTMFILLKSFRFKSAKIKRKNLLELLILFTLVFSLSLAAIFIPLNKAVVYDDETYHLPIINDIAANGQKTFFADPHNIYQVRSNQFPLLFESFVGTTKFFLESDLFWFVSFFSLIISLFLIFFISKELGHNEFFSATIYGVSYGVLVYSRYFTVEIFLSMFFLGSVFFVLNYLKTENRFFLLVSGFFTGLMFLTKLTGAIFFLGFFLFFLYKRKFKAILFFSLIFILISSVFLVSHSNVQIEKDSVGAYGELISSDLLTQVPSNFFRVCEIFWLSLLTNFYVFFVPFLLILAWFWRKDKEKDFLLLFSISAIFFLFVTFFNQAYPSFNGFLRYFLPIYSLLCILSGIQLKKIVLTKTKKVSVFLMVLFLALVLFISVSSLTIFATDFLSKDNYSSKKIENKSEVNMWFVDSAALTLRLDKANLYDYAWKADFSGDPCYFLRKHQIDYVVYINLVVPVPDYLGDFGLRLEESLSNEECAKVFSKTSSSVVYQVNEDNKTAQET